MWSPGSFLDCDWPHGLLTIFVPLPGQSELSGQTRGKLYIRETVLKWIFEHTKQKLPLNNNNKNYLSRSVGGNRVTTNAGCGVFEKGVCHPRAATLLCKTLYASQRPSQFMKGRGRAGSLGLPLCCSQEWLQRQQERLEQGVGGWQHFIRGILLQNLISSVSRESNLHLEILLNQNPSFQWPTCPP